MGKLKTDEKGFGAVEAILIVIIIVLIGAVGYLVYKNNHKTVVTKVVTVTKAIDSSTSSPPQGNYVNVIQDDSSVTQVAPDKIAKTTDEAKILQVMHETCKDSSSSNVTVNHAAFDGSTNFKQSGNYASINAGKCDKPVTTLDQLGGSGALNFLHKNSQETWVYDFGGQQAPLCSDVDGLGYPTSVLPTCVNADGSTRAPK
jgi:hypothetical protein